MGSTLGSAATQAAAALDGRWDRVSPSLEVYARALLEASGRPQAATPLALTHKNIPHLPVASRALDIGRMTCSSPCLLRATASGKRRTQTRRDQPTNDWLHSAAASAASM